MYFILPEDFTDLIKKRRSIRKLIGPVDEKIILEIIENARWAPSAGNLQSWDIILVKSEERKTALARAALNQTFIAEAPVVLVVCANLRRSARIYGARGASLYCLQDTAAFIQTLLLLITAHGLGACWVGAFDEEQVATVVETVIQKGIRPIALIPIGKSAENPVPPPRLPLKKILSFEKHGQKDDD
ncbi:MAG: nitroreductase family protein [Candidatus Helarchaeales archaeon]